MSLYLPRTEFLARPAAAPQENPALVPDRKTVLVVEDNAPVADVCKSYLDELGYAVEFASSPHDALAFLRGTGHVDIGLSDILMPGGMSGLDFARAVRQTRPTLPIMLMTGFSTSAKEVARDGFPVLRKPFDLTTLRNELTAIFERHDAPKERCRAAVGEVA